MLIGLCGAPGCGKTTLAYELVMHDVYEQYGMADPIKRMLREFHIQDDVWDDHARKEKPIPWLGRSPRYMAQTLGTEWGRNLIHEDVWLKLAKGRWHHLNACKEGRMVVPDIRFENEAEWIRDDGGILVEIVRPSLEHEADNAKHASEAGFNQRLISCRVYNTGTKEDLREKAWLAIRERLGLG